MFDSVGTIAEQVFNVGDYAHHTNEHGYTYVYLIESRVGSDYYNLVIPNKNGSMPKRASVRIRDVHKSQIDRFIGVTESRQK